MRGEDPLLFCGRQPRVERQHLGVLEITQSLCGVADLALTRQEHQHVAGRFLLEFGDGVDDRLGLVAQLGPDDFVVGIVGIVTIFGSDGDFQWAVTDFDGIGPPGDFHDRGAESFSREMRGETLRFDGRRRDDHLEIGSPRQQLAQIAEQEVDVEAALVGLVEDESVVAQQAAVALNLREQNAVGHQLHQRAVTDLIGEPDGVADGLTQRSAQLVGDALADCAGREPAGLRVPDGAADTAADVLGRFWGAASSYPTRFRLRPRPPDAFYRLGDLPAAFADRQGRVGDRRRRPAGSRRALRRQPSVRRSAAAVGIRGAEVLQGPPSRAASRKVRPSRRLRNSATDGWDTRARIGLHGPQFCRGISSVTNFSRKSERATSPAGLMTNFVNPAAM